MRFVAQSGGFLTFGISVPHDYDDLLSYYTRRGYRVIAIAGKSVEGLSWLRAQKMKRFGLVLSYGDTFSRFCQRTSRIESPFPRADHL